MFTKDTLEKLWPHGDICVPGLRDGIVSAAPAVLSAHGLTTNLLVAQAMAQFSHECGAGTEMVENLNYSDIGLRQTWPTRFDAQRASQFAHRPQQIANAVYNGRMGNRIGSNDGWTFRGRGLSQCTGREGYEKLSAKTGLDLVGNPDLINDPRYALLCGVEDFILCGCLAPAQQDDIVQVTQKLNGGQIGIGYRKEWLAKWKAALGNDAPLIPIPPDIAKPEPTPQPVPQPAPSGGFFMSIVNFILSIFKRT